VVNGVKAFGGFGEIFVWVTTVYVDRPTWSIHSVIQDPPTEYKYSDYSGFPKLWNSGVHPEYNFFIV